MGKDKAQPGGRKVPAWIVSFSDMITLLLAFFVLLQAFASSQDPDLFHAGKGSFNRAIQGLGIPELLFGKSAESSRNWRRIKYPMAEDPDRITRRRRIDAEDQKIRKIFGRLREEFATETSDRVERMSQVWPTSISFLQGEAELNDAGRREIRGIADLLRKALRQSAAKIYVAGSAPDAPGGQRSWALSARRAAAVATQLRSALAHKLQANQWEVHSFGRGPDGGTQGGQSPGSQPTFIVIAVAKG